MVGSQGAVRCLRTAQRCCNGCSGVWILKKNGGKQNNDHKHSPQEMWEVFQVFQPKLEEQETNKWRRYSVQEGPPLSFPSSIKHLMTQVPCRPCRLAQMLVHLHCSAGWLVSSSSPPRDSHAGKEEAEKHRAKAGHLPPLLSVSVSESPGRQRERRRRRGYFFNPKRP